MRFTRLVPPLFATSIVFLYGIGANAQTVATFTTNLSLGSSGTQVVALQKILNESPDTQVASTGPGSPGEETGYFGLLTQAAVMRFQTKYASQVLTPAGLTQASGYVGSYTRGVLNAFAAVAVNTSVPTSTSVMGTSTSLSVSTGATQGPTQATLDAYIAAVNSLGAQQGMSPSTLATVDADIRQEMATSSTVFLQQFFEQQRTMYESKQLSESSLDSPLVALYESVSAFIRQTFVTPKAYAQTLPEGWKPFGGYITAIVPCTCAPAIDSIFVSLPYPNPTVTNLLLDYVIGSEGFNWHNIPEPGIATLGLYTPNAAPVCYIGVEPACVALPGEGLILPVAGSSPTPA